jgi:uncharacterized protein YecT (DUF1311 family)
MEFHMFKQFARAALVATLFLASAAHAQQPDADVDCAKVNKDGGNQYDMNICQAREYAAADADLNKAYGKLRAQFNGDKDSEKRLIKAQRAWVAFRDAEGALCADNYGFGEGGSGYGMVLQSCKTDLTKERTEALRKHLRQAESL